MEIYKKVPLIMAEVGAISKDRRNDSQGYAFRGIEDMYAAFHPVLVKHGVFCVPNVLSTESQVIDGMTAQGKPKTSFRVVMRVEHRFFAPDGSFVAATTTGEGLDTSDKASNKAMSAAMKYAFIETFCVPTQDIADSDRESPTVDRHVSKVDSLISAFDNYQPEPLPKLASPASPNDLGSTVITFGKSFKGKTFAEVGAKVLEDYLQTTMKYYHDQKKPLPEALDKLMPIADEWICSERMKG
jgi:hypothetical protein